MWKIFYYSFQQLKVQYIYSNNPFRSATRSMGQFCLSKPKNNDSDKATKVKTQPSSAKSDGKEQKINSKQQKLLKLIYTDLASRSPKNELTLENFQLFFHKNGYWGQRLFKQFDRRDTNTIGERQFIRGIVRIFKTTEQQKIELLYKFFSDNNMTEGISFSNFLTMLYNYPKEDLKIILNDEEFINKELKRNLVVAESSLLGKKLQTLDSFDLKNANGKAFIINSDTESNSQRRESKYADKVIQELNKSNKEQRISFKIAIGQNDVEIKTTSIHHLVKKYARSTFKNYNINETTGRFKYENFRDWIIHHKNLYNVYYEGFHCQAWQVNCTTNSPIYLTKQTEYTSKAKIHEEHGVKSQYVVLSLLHSILIVCDEKDNVQPLRLICLEGLAANQIFDHANGHGIQISHRDGVYKNTKFYFFNEQIQQKWMEHLQFFKGNSVNQFYQIKQKIGMGKFSVVYNCTQKATQQQYAIKVIESYKLDPAAKVILAHESNIMSVMSHPYLVFFKECITTKTHIYIITELVKGKDLFDFVKDLKYLEEPEVMYIIEQVLIGVLYIHSLSILHRDLKPQNIMIEYDEKNNKLGRVKIIDFGFANYLSNLRQLPKDQLWAGTPNYIAPEILKQQPFDEKIDNFAIGSILYYLLSGTLPFNSLDVGTILRRTIEGDYHMTSRRWNRVSEEAKDLVSKLLEVNPADRITLEDALKHCWFQKVRKSRQSSTSMKLQISLEQREEKIKAQRKTENRELIY